MMMPINMPIREFILELWLPGSVICVAVILVDRLLVEPLRKRKGTAKKSTRWSS